MKKAVLTGINQIEVREFERPVLGTDDEVLLKISHVGICGSDMHYYKEGKIGEQIVHYPFTVGHECSATIAAVGKQVNHLKTGQQVFVEPAISCQTCSQCLAGRENTCLNVRFLGAAGQLSGALAEYIVMPARNCFPLPPNLTLKQAALIEPLSIAWHAVHYLQKQKDAQNVAILGSGPIGLCVMSVVRALHRVSVYMTDKLDYRLSVAVNSGADWTGNPLEVNIEKEIAKICPGQIDVVFECAGEQEALDQALQLLKPGGKLIIVGIPGVERISFDIDLLRRKEITIYNVRRQNKAVEPVIELLKDGKIDTGHLISHVLPLKNCQDAFSLVAGYKDEVIKALVSVS